MQKNGANGTRDMSISKLSLVLLPKMVRECYEKWCNFALFGSVSVFVVVLMTLCCFGVMFGVFGEGEGRELLLVCVVGIGFV